METGIMALESDNLCGPGAGKLERVRYYPRQLVTASVLTTDQDYLRQKARRHNRLLHGWGVVCGLEVKPDPTEESPWRVIVCPGYLLDPAGEEVPIAEPVHVDLATGAQTQSDPCAGATPCPPAAAVPGEGETRFVFLAARYRECLSRPERVPSVACGCDETACEYARIRDGFELKVLLALPESHRRAAAADAAWCERVRAWARADVRGPAPVPPCPECPTDPWVVLARIRLPQQGQGPIAETHIDYEGRRVLYGVSALSTLGQCV
jgi:hypothetical protein